MTTFDELVHGLFADLFRVNPVFATLIGNHDHDGEWPDQTEYGSRSLVALLDRWADAFRALPADALTAGQAVDRDIVLAELAALRFGETEMRAETWDPLAYVYLLGDGIHLLLAREFAPLGVRLASVAERVEGIPAVVSAARARLVGTPDRPVSRLHVEVALAQLPAWVSCAGRPSRPRRTPTRRASWPPSEPAWSPPLLSRRPRLMFCGPPSDVVLPRAEGEGRLGEALFAAKLRHTLQVELTPDALEDRARREFAAVRAEMVRMARDLWPALRPGEPVPDEEGALVRGALDTIAERHQAPAGMLDFCREELARVEAFCREYDVIGLSEEPLAIEWTPLFLRAFGGAMLSSPGPLDRGLRSYFYVTPPPDDWTPEQVESALREDNDRMLVTLVIHEAVPGHYLQLAYANRSPSFVRAALASGVFAEGWAVYVTQVMMDLGYAAHDPALLLSTGSSTCAS